MSGAGRGLRCLRLGLLAAVVATAGGTAAADESGGQTICLGRYALCSSAECDPIENELSGYTQLWSFYADIPELEYCPR